MRRIDTSTTGSVTSASCGFSAGERVEHPRFGRGTIVRVEPMATDHKLVIDFADYGEKTLIARLAKLTKL